MSKDEYLFMEQFISEAVYDDYDRLVQLCNSLALPNGFCLLEKRLVDVTLRYGVHKATIPTGKECIKSSSRLKKKWGAQSMMFCRVVWRILSYFNQYHHNSTLHCYKLHNKKRIPAKAQPAIFHHYNISYRLLFSYRQTLAHLVAHFHPYL